MQLSCAVEKRLVGITYYTYYLPTSANRDKQVIVFRKKDVKFKKAINNLGLMSSKTSFHKKFWLNTSTDRMLSKNLFVIIVVAVGVPTLVENILNWCVAWTVAFTIHSLLQENGNDFLVSIRERS